MEQKHKLNQFKLLLHRFKIAPINKRAGITDISLELALRMLVIAAGVAVGAVAMINAKDYLLNSKLKSYETMIMQAMFNEPQLLGYGTGGTTPEDSFADEAAMRVSAAALLNKYLEGKALIELEPSTGKYLSQMTDPWGSRFEVLFITEDVQPNSSEFKVIVKSNGKNKKSPAADEIDDDDGILLVQNRNSTITSDLGHSAKFHAVDNDATLSDIKFGTSNFSTKTAHLRSAFLPY